MLAIVVLVETSVIAYWYISHGGAPNGVTQYVSTSHTIAVFPFYLFNQPISNDTNYSLNSTYDGSWIMTIQSQLAVSPTNLKGSEAQIAIAPEYPSENLSIPTIIVQERGDGLMRIEYYAQNWNNTYGLILYNSTSPSWMNENVTIKFIRFGPPAPVNPQIAPRPNGNLTIVVGSTVVLSDYPVAWVNLSMLYIYGLHGSLFTAGGITITIDRISPNG